MKKLILPLLASLVVAGLGSHIVTAAPGWHQHIDWAIGDTGAPDCSDWPGYRAYPACLAFDPPLNRACLMRKAISSAKANDYSNAKMLVLTTQCHNDDAYRELDRVSERDIGEYLKTK